MKVLICGGREFRNALLAFMWLDKLHAEVGVTVAVHGDAPGADTLSGEWARSRGIAVDVYPADWTLLGNAAGSARNTKMLREAKPDMVFALPGGRGTLDMVSQAKAAGIPVRFATMMR
ncbi:hypothetical protein WS89_03895 [Burkholderia sp. MSMB1072]|uniref:DUF2493 domain-containing protein n=1 Tax=Burkholderia sp. MSMB1072 TaxID=1637871 RepID=UPI00075444CA|nr:DUF2493 domain-containing protein [Burkholderia sp. MSMB1072]KVH64434.1 hypothetical protein WS89_03895 [Burkholderia sp. MSMB1072]